MTNCKLQTRNKGKNLQKSFLKVNGFGFEKIMDFTMNIEKLNLANLVWGR